MSAPFDTLPETSEVDRATPRRMGPRVTFILILILVTGLSLLYLSQTSDLAATSYDVAALQDEKAIWEMRNEQLRLQIAELQSLDRVDQVASTRLGMGPPTHVVYVNAPTQPFALATPTSVPPPAADRVSAFSVAGLIQRLQPGPGRQLGQ